MSSHANAVLDKLPPIFDTVDTENESKKAGRKGRAERISINKLSPHLQSLMDAGIRFSFTVKFDGSCMMIRNGLLCKRRDLKMKKGKKSFDYPTGWFQTGEATDETHLIGFMPIDLNSKEDAHMASTLSKDGRARVLLADPSGDFEEKLGALEQMVPLEELEGRTCEFLGPKSQGNLYGLERHCLLLHGEFRISNPPHILDLEVFRSWMEEQGKGIEGIVLHFENGNCFKVHRQHLRLNWENGNVKQFNIKVVDH